MAEYKTLTIGQFCKLLQISRKTADRMIRKGKTPPPHKVGGQIRFDYQEFARWWEEETISSGKNVLLPNPG